MQKEYLSPDCIIVYMNEDVVRTSNPTFIGGDDTLNCPNEPWGDLFKNNG